MTNMDMSKSIVEFTPYQVTDGSPGSIPLSGALVEMGGPYLFSYENGVGLQRIDDPDSHQRRGHLNHSHASIFIYQNLDLGNSIFLISPIHPKESCCPKRSDGYGGWRTLAFENIGAECSLDHFGNLNYLDLIHNSRASWAPLFAGTGHVRPLTGGTVGSPSVLSGLPEILWGLVALNVGDDIGNLSAYIRFLDQGRFGLTWSPGIQPDRRPSRALAVTIYHNESESKRFPISLI